MRKSCTLGIIGCGRVVEQLYVPALKTLINAQVIAVADLRRSRCDLIGAHLDDCERFESADRLLEQAKPDAVIIATSPDAHAELVVKALRYGIPAFVEKPLTTGVENLRELLTLPETVCRPIMVGFNRRFWQPVRDLRRVLASRNGRQLLTARMVMMSALDQWKPLSGLSDALDDLGCHQLDLLRYLFNSEIESISARWSNPDSIGMQVTMASGIRAHCLAAHSKPSQEHISVQGEDVRCRIIRGSERIRPIFAPWRKVLDMKDTLARKAAGKSSSLRDSYRKQLQTFVDAVRNEHSPKPDLSDGIAVVRAVAAARRSASESGRKVRLMEFAE